MSKVANMDPALVILAGGILYYNSDIRGRQHVFDVAVGALGLVLCCDHCLLRACYCTSRIMFKWIGTGAVME